MTGFLSHSKKLDKHNSLYHNIIDTQTIAQNNFRNVFDSVLEGYQGLHDDGSSQENTDEIGGYILDIDSLKDMYMQVNGTEEDEYFFALLNEVFDPRTSRSRSVILEKLRYKLMYYVMVLGNTLHNEKASARSKSKD
ncbi:MAG: hypothetical protein WC004_02215 [Candidatus Absconditabacterales bacterium]